MSDENDTFFDKLTIKVDEPIMSLSISPRNRDVCLGARKGLYIIDLANCYEPPMFLPHVSAWEVADVQWSPHPSRAHWISSAAGGSALIWNLHLKNRRSPIEYTLVGHTRTVTDINFSVFELDHIATCSLDGHILTWDLRSSGRRPASGFLSCNMAATQVKYSRQNPCLIASAHDNIVNLWDLRKASRPVLTIQAHNQRCYGLDFDRRSSDRFVTCSLDRTIKYWSISKPEAPLRTIHTTAPVWRARNLPFGAGVLALPQRSETALKMYSETGDLIETYEGHNDVPKEFVWRTRGGADPQFDDRQFQLVSWGRDRVLRTFPISSETLGKTGHVQGAPIDVRMTRRNYESTSFRNDISPDLVPKESSASIHSPDDRGMSSVTKRRQRPGLSSSWKRSGESLGTSPLSDTAYRSSYSDASNPPSWKLKAAVARFSPRPAYMTRTKTQVGKMQKTMAWMESVNAQTEQNTTDTLPKPNTTPVVPLQHRLKEEFMTINKNYSGRILFEKTNVSAGTCTISCFSPYGIDGSQCFIKTHLDFPSDYPWHAPGISVEKNIELVPKQRAFLLTGLRNLLASHTAKGLPSLDAFVRFLLGDLVSLDTDDSSENEEEAARPARVNVPLPRRSGAVFGPRNELIVFFPFSSATTQPEITESHSQARTSTSPGAHRNTLLLDSFGAIGTTAGESATENSESDDALRVPRLISTRTRRGTMSSSRKPDTTSMTSTVVYIRHRVTDLRSDLLTALSSLTLSASPPQIINSLLARYEGSGLVTQLYLLIRDVVAKPDHFGLPFYRVILSKGLKALAHRRDTFHLTLMLCVLQLALKRQNQAQLAQSQRERPVARIKPTFSAMSRSASRNERSTLVKFNEVERAPDWQGKKRVKITMVPQERPGLELLDLPMDITQLMIFFADLCVRWQLRELRAEVLSLLPPARTGQQRAQDSRIASLSGLDPAHLSFEIHCPACHNIMPERCGMHTITCVVCHRLSRGLIKVCALCLHGGHASCVEAWVKEGEASCPVTGCKCSCAKDGGLKGTFWVARM